MRFFSSRSRSRQNLQKRLTPDWVAVGAAVLLFVAAIGALFAPLLAPASPSQVDLVNRLLPPGTSGEQMTFILGTDALGRDILSRILFGMRSSFIIGVGVVIVAGVIGAVLGLLAGYRGGWLDTVTMRVADAQFAFPGLLLTIVVIGVLGPSVGTIIIVLTIYGWMIYARLVRGNVLQLRETLYVRAAELVGAKSSRVMRVHMVPNLLAPLATVAILELARVMLVEASLSYLGLGIQPPNVSLGLMVAENQVYLRDGWWTVVFPGLVLALVILALNLLMSSLRGSESVRWTEIDVATPLDPTETDGVDHAV